jgi:21S rRNA (uridine2791-2'-O)-methyltransferase
LRKQVSSRDEEGVTEADLEEMERGYIDIERHAHLEGVEPEKVGQPAEEKQEDLPDEKKLCLKERDLRHGRVVDVVLSDMSEPWDQTVGFHKRSLSDPYFRMMNTSGNAFRDHAGSMVGRSLLTTTVD